MLGSTQVSGGEVLWKSFFKKKEQVRFCSSFNWTQVRQMEWVNLLPLVQIYSHLRGSRQLKELKLQKQAESEPADNFCVWDEGLEPLKP